MELFKLTINEKSKAETYLIPLKTPGSYRYENEKGQRFFVIAASLMGESYKTAPKCENYTSNYYRIKQLTEAIEYLSGREMAVKICSKSPDLYMVALENEDKTALTVLLINPFIDEVMDLEFVLGDSYSKIKFISCEGKFDGDKVTVNYLEPYGFMAVEVKK